MTFSDIAAAAIDSLADEMIPKEFPTNWQAIDSICRRWPHLTGRADNRLAAIRRKQERARLAALQDQWGRDSNAFHVMPNPYR